MADMTAVIKNADMSEQMQCFAISMARQTVNKMPNGDAAKFIKKGMDDKFGRSWQCCVGNFGSYVTHETRHFIYFYLGQVGILLFKSG